MHRVEGEKQADRGVQLLLSRSTNADIGMRRIVQKCVIVALYVVFLLYGPIFFFPNLPFSFRVSMKKHRYAFILNLNFNENQYQKLEAHIWVTRGAFPLWE